MISLQDEVIGHSSRADGVFVQHKVDEIVEDVSGELDTPEGE